MDIAHSRYRWSWLAYSKRDWDDALLLALNCHAEKEESGESFHFHPFMESA
jgi:hypothetical protein